jgi:hypothetical protein
MKIDPISKLWMEKNANLLRAISGGASAAAPAALRSVDPALLRAGQPSRGGFPWVKAGLLGAGGYGLYSNPELIGQAGDKLKAVGSAITGSGGQPSQSAQPTETPLTGLFGDKPAGGRYSDVTSDRGEPSEVNKIFPEKGFPDPAPEESNVSDAQINALMDQKYGQPGEQSGQKPSITLEQLKEIIGKGGFQSGAGSGVAPTRSSYTPIRPKNFDPSLQIREPKKQEDGANSAEGIVDRLLASQSQGPALNNDEDIALRRLRNKVSPKDTVPYGFGRKLDEKDKLPKMKKYQPEVTSGGLARLMKTLGSSEEGIEPVSNYFKLQENPVQEAPITQSINESGGRAEEEQRLQQMILKELQRRLGS